MYSEGTTILYFVFPLEKPEKRGQNNSVLTTYMYALIICPGNPKLDNNGYFFLFLVGTTM